MKKEATGKRNRSSLDENGDFDTKDDVKTNVHKAKLSDADASTSTRSFDSKSFGDLGDLFNDDKLNHPINVNCAVFRVVIAAFSL